MSRLPRNAKRPSKYGAKAAVVDGIRFHSQKEARRYWELKSLQKAGEIRGLILQPKWPLAVSDNVVGSEPKIIGTYVGDFAYEMSCDGTIPLEWEMVVEDVKGFKTPLYRWKKKHVEAQYGIHIREI